MPKQHKDNDAQLHIRLPQPTIDRLRALAARVDMRRSVVARVALGVSLTPELHLKFAQRLGLDWRCSRAELTSTVQDALAALTDIDLEASKGLTDEQFVAFACAANKRRSASKPAPSPGTDPVASLGTAPPKQRASAAPEPANDDADEEPPPEGETERQELERLRRNKARQQRRDKKGAAPAKSARAAKAQTRSVAPAIVLSSAEYGRLLALRAKRAGKPAPDRQPSANTFTVRGDDADAQAIVAARGGK